MNGQNRNNIKPGIEVEIIKKQDQRSGKRTRGRVKDILTSSAYHPHGIKVRLETGEVGRVQAIISLDSG
ncbi:MAG: YwbE family protein [Acidobacteria bacterium]|nr:YwbE family protein [Acidobacteriota bacterium]